MNTLSRHVMTLALTAAFAAPIAVLAADKPAGDHASHHPEQAQTEKASGNQMQDHSMKMHARMEAMQARMKAMEKTSDPKARIPMMKAQMEDMQAVMKEMDSNCPMAGGKDGMDKMGGSHDDMMGHDMHGGGMGGNGDHMKQPAK
ncbi:MAG: hypothetical protein WAO76_09655 [Georgfuchsia sp.]